MDDYVFDCIRCGECCKVLRKPEASKKDFLYGYNIQGKLTKSPQTTTTVFYYERQKIINYIGKNYTNHSKKFIPLRSFFLKNFPIEFVYFYQVKVNGEYCIFYDINKKSCNIYPVRPVICRAFPLQINQGIINDNLNYDPNLGHCTSFESEIKKRYPHIQNGMRINIDIERSAFNLHFPNQYEHLKLEEYMLLKFFIFSEEWIDFFIPPFKIDPRMVRKYDRIDMSKFLSWLKENKDRLDRKKILNSIRQYKLRISELNNQFNITTNLDFL